MSTNTRKPGKNIQPPCVSCARKESPTAIMSWNTAPQKRLHIYQVAPPDACEGLNNDKLNNLSMFFSDPCAKPSQTQSPARSPTAFPLLLQAPAAGNTAVSLRVTNSIPGFTSSPSFEVTATGTMSGSSGTFQIDGSFTVTPPTGVNSPFTLFIRMPRQFRASTTGVDGGFYFGSCASGDIDQNLIQETDGAYTSGTINGLSAGVRCTVRFSLLLVQ